MRMLWMVWPVWLKWLATGLLKRFQSSCGRQHRQQPLLHNCKWLFSRQVENEGEMRMLSESVDMSTRKYGVSACWLHTRSSRALPAIRTLDASVARALQSSHLEEMESYDRKKRSPRGLYTYSAGNKPSQVECTSHWKSQSSTLVWCNSTHYLDFILFFKEDR